MFLLDVPLLLLLGFFLFFFTYDQSRKQAGDQQSDDPFERLFHAEIYAVQDDEKGTNEDDAEGEEVADEDAPPRQQTVI